jgi:hypothetical protein
MSDLPARRSLLVLLGSAFVGGCTGREPSSEPTTTRRTTDPSDEPATTGTEPPSTTDHTPPPTGDADVPDLLVRNGAGTDVTVTVEVTPVSGEAFSATLTLADDGSREFETVDPLNEVGTLTVTVESREGRAEYDLPAQPTLVVTVTADGVTFGRLMA